MVFITDLEDSPTYDVFINHRGVDTRYSIAEELHSNLHQQGIRTFIDDELIRRAEDTSTPFKAIEGSKISIIIFSENYASSEWCLDQLVKILQCKESKEQVVTPIFYHVQPSDVGNQKGSFGEAFAIHECKYKNDKEKVQKWRNALTEATNLPGYLFRDGHESQFVHLVVADIIKVLNRPYLNVGNYLLVGMDARVREVNELLGLGLNDIRTVGIWGCGGIGKTTITKAVYNSIAHRFEVSCFLENVRENSLEQRGLLQLQKTLLSEILGENIFVTDVNKGAKLIRTRLRHKRVLLILDDVDQLDQLKKLGGGSDSFGPGSRIIITTRKRDILAAHQVDVIYEIKGLDPYEAFELFSSNAFANGRVPKNCVKFAGTIVTYTQGYPLGLTALGSFLRGKSMDHWQIVSDICKTAPKVDIQEILEITCNVLNHPQKAIVQHTPGFPLGLTALRSSLRGKSTDQWQIVSDMCKRAPKVSIQEILEITNVLNPPQKATVQHTRGFPLGLTTLRGKSTDHQWQIVSDICKIAPVDIQEILKITCNVLNHPQNAPTDIEGNHVWTHEVLEQSAHQGSQTKPKEEIFFSFKRVSKVFSAEWTFLLIALCLEMLSIAFDQAASPRKPQYALVGMLLAIGALLISISELVYKGMKQRVKLMRCGMLWWFYHVRPRRRAFGSLPEIYGLIGGISQSACSIIQYVCFIRHAENPIKVSLWPAIFLVCLGVSRLNKGER